MRPGKRCRSRRCIIFSVSRSSRMNTKWVRTRTMAAVTFLVAVTALMFVDRTPVAQVPPIERKASILETDTEFANGSRIDVDQLSAVQIDNLVMLGEVW